MKRTFSVTTWDSLTNETDTHTVTIHDPSKAIGIAVQIHGGLCVAMQEDPTDWRMVGEHLQSGPGGTVGVTIWRANDGTISTENFVEFK